MRFYPSMGNVSAPLSSHISKCVELLSKTAFILLYYIVPLSALNLEDESPKQSLQGTYSLNGETGQCTTDTHTHTGTKLDTLVCLCGCSCVQLLLCVSRKCTYSTYTAHVNTHALGNNKGTFKPNLI